MTCPFDLKEYVLGEATRETAAAVESHARECAGCREELGRLQMIHATLLTLRDEELPRRIAFVSDKVFEPRWYQRLWHSAHQLGFVAAAMLACAILVHALVRPPQSGPPATAKIDAQAIEQQVEREVSARLQTAVTKAVADSETRQKQHTAELLQAAEQRYEMDRRATLAAVAEQTRILQKQVNTMYAAAYNLRAGE